MPVCNCRGRCHERVPMIRIPVSRWWLHFTCISAFRTHERIHVRNPHEVAWLEEFRDLFVRLERVAQARHIRRRVEPGTGVVVSRAHRSTQLLGHRPHGKDARALPGAPDALGQRRRPLAEMHRLAGRDPDVDRFCDR